MINLFKIIAKKENLQYNHDMKKYFLAFFTFLLFALVSCSEHKDVVIVNSIFDLRDKKIGCIAESRAPQFVQENVPRAEIVLFDTDEQLLEKLKSAEIAVAILDKDFATSLVETNEDFALSDQDLPDNSLAIVQRAFDMHITSFWRLHDEVGADF